MIDWETIAVFMLVDSVVHIVIGLLFLPIGGKFMVWFAKRTLFKKPSKTVKKKVEEIKADAKSIEELFEVK